MPILEVDEIVDTDDVEADVCIIGSGPSGCTVASELAGGNLRVIILESGGREREPAVDALNEIESIGWPRVMDQWIVRNRMLGGSSATWKGKCAPFDDLDYEFRDWVPYSGWPIRPSELNPFLERSTRHIGIGLGTGYTGKEFGATVRRPQPSFDEELLLPFYWQYAKDARNPFDYMRFGKRLASGVAGDAKVLLHATATHINTNEEGTAVNSVEVRSRTGKVLTVKASSIVLCAGGIENARLLLASNRKFSRGIGNDADLVGRFLMDHPRGPVATFDPGRATQVLSSFGGFFDVKSKSGTHRFRNGMALSPHYQREHKLLNCAVFVEEQLARDDPWGALMRILRGRGAPQDVGYVGSQLGLLTRGIKAYVVDKQSPPRKIERIELLGIVEQPPNPDSRITLSDRRDRFDVPLSRIDWKVSEVEQRTVMTTARLVVSEFERIGLEPPILEEWVIKDGGFPQDLQDAAHPTGTTRMSTSPESGVVDTHCEVFGVRGLFVAGTSIFPTAGHANPTQMIVAFAIRLADRLKKR